VHRDGLDFLLLNLKQIQKLYPESEIYVLDSGSEQETLHAARKSIEQFRNVTLFSSDIDERSQYPFLRPKILPKPCADLIGSLRHGSFSHAVGLQFLLNYCAERSDRIAVFLDQDCVLCNAVDTLAAKLEGNDILLVGPRDYVVAPKDYGPLKQGEFVRDNYDLVHASFMILRPKLIRRLFGDYSLFDRRFQNEPYHGISYKTQGRILFLETRMHEEVPILTGYLYQGVTYAWHAWYSSSKRTAGLSPQDFVDDVVPVWWLREVRRLAFKRMEQIHEATFCR